MLDAQWLSELGQQANRPPAHPRHALVVGGCAVGSVDARVAERLWHELNACDSAQPFAPLLKRGLAQCQPTLCLDGRDLQGRLDALALSLRELGLTRTWRNESLAVQGPQGERLGTIERGVVRILGLATRAVHLVGRSPEGHHWVQQRSHDKDNDPGQWDTLMGGMVPATDSVDQALARETWEEAGLRIDQLHGLRHRGCIRLQKPLLHTPGQGYVVEDVDWFEAVVPQGLEPVNQDGEVDHFECIDEPELIGRLHAGLFTAEAAMILAAALGHSA